MCGIAGFFDPSGKRAEGSSELLRRMTRTLVRRGPDAEGYFESDGFAIGHRRLKIIDLEGGTQPMTSPDGRHTVGFNGEIYNFMEIRERLEACGRVFQTRSDTESLLALFEEKGAESFAELEGMFAAVIWDKPKNTLWAAVDPFGKKPLYYAQKSGVFVFASEPKALLLYPGLSREVDPESLVRYLAFEYVPASKTIFKGIHKLRGGTAIEVSASGTRIIEYTRPIRRDSNPSASATMEELKFLFREAVRKRLVSDVPLGVFLSGGIDSSSVLAQMRALDPGRKIRTFTIGFDEPSFDESAYAREASRHFATEHIEERFTVNSMLCRHEEILGYLDEPLADASFIPTFLLSELVRKHVTVALGGDGGDELFGGYPTFDAARWADRLSPTAGAAGVLLRAGASALPVSTENLSFEFKLKQFAKGLGLPPRARNQVWLGAFSEPELRQILKPEWRGPAAGVFKILDDTLGPVSADAMDDLQNFYLKFYLEGDILVKSDRASMANSLEVRSPLLDDRLARFVRSLPASIRFSPRTPKALLKRMMRGRVPDSILKRKKKGFGIPIAHWIRGSLRTSFESALSEERIRREGFFEPREVSRLLAEHLAGRRDNRKKLWTLYVFQKWQEQWLSAGR